MVGFFSNILLMLAWGLLTGSFSPTNLLLGFVISYLALAILQRQIPALVGYPQRIPRFVGFVFFFIKELFLANFKVAFDILTPTWHMRPGVIAFPLKAKTDFEITLLANLISLTPGTLSLDVSEDREQLFIHAMFLTDETALVDDLRDIEQRLLAILR